jgi:hypothetical protein
MHAAHAALVRLATDATETTSETHNELPIAPEAFGLIAFGGLMFLLLVTWAFRSVGSRH